MPKEKTRTDSARRTSRKSTSCSPTNARFPNTAGWLDRAEIADTHDYNLNIRRYVDNTPEPEPEDVQAHLIGGIPATEVTAQSPRFAKFGLACETLFSRTDRDT